MDLHCLEELKLGAFKSGKSYKLSGHQIPSFLILFIFFKYCVKNIVLLLKFSKQIYYIPNILNIS